MAKIISFINYKGGVGKTTTAYHIGCSLAYHHKKRVLLVDIDPQTNLTFLCVLPERWDRFRQTNGTLASLYRAHMAREAFDINRVLWSSPIEGEGRQLIPNLDLIPSDVELLTIDLDLQARVQQTQDLKDAAHFFLEQRSILRKALAQVEATYDYILIDCPPNLYLVTQNALAASQGYLIATIPDYLSTVGLEILTERIQKLSTELSLASQLTDTHVSQPELRGIVFVRIRLGGSRVARVHVKTMEDIRGRRPNLCFRNYTTELIGYSEAAELAVPVFLASTPNAPRAADEYPLIAEEFLQRFGP